MSESFGLDLAIKNIKEGNYSDADVKLVMERCVNYRSKISQWCDALAKSEQKVKELESALRWIPVTEQLPPEGADVDFLCVSGYDGYGHIHRENKEWCEKYHLSHDPTPIMTEYEGGPYHIGKDDFGNWGVTHWRLRPGTQPDFDKFFQDNES
jgi:hypothetical protein